MLSEELFNPPVAVQKLTERMESLTEWMGELVIAQWRTDERVDVLPGAQMRTEVCAEELAQMQVQLAEAQSAKREGDKSIC